MSSVFYYFLNFKNKKTPESNEAIGSFLTIYNYFFEEVEAFLVVLVFFEQDFVEEEQDFVEEEQDLEDDLHEEP